MKISQLLFELLILLTKWFVGVYVGIMIGVIIAEMRIEKMRPMVTHNAVIQGVREGIERYKEEYLRGEHLNFAKRKKRDARLKQYIKRLDTVFEEGLE